MSWNMGLMLAVAMVLVAAAIHSNYTQRSDNQTNPMVGASTLVINIPAFTDGASIPPKYTCDSTELVSPALQISGVPESAKSLALVMDDPDVPKQLKPDGLFVHWVLFNIPASAKDIPERGSAGVVGQNSAGRQTYIGPCPPKEYEPNEHRYVFKLYALDTMLPLQAGATKEMLEQAMARHIVGQGQYTGRYKRPSGERGSTERSSANVRF